MGEIKCGDPWIVDNSQCIFVSCSDKECEQGEEVIITCEITKQLAANTSDNNKWNYYSDMWTNTEISDSKTLFFYSLSNSLIVEFNGKLLDINHNLGRSLSDMFGVGEFVNLDHSVTRQDWIDL
jgi:hypothetical protein